MSLRECNTCNHQPHDPGQCKSCNCGQSQISHATMPMMPGDYKIEYDRRRSGSTLVAYGNNRGHRVPRKTQQ